MTEVQAVDVKSVGLLHNELVWWLVATTAKCLTVDIGTKQNSCLQTQVLSVTKLLKPNQDVNCKIHPECTLAHYDILTSVMV